MNNLRHVLSGLILFLMCNGCASPQQTDSAQVPPPQRPAVINHVVFFDLNDPADAPALIRACNQHLAPIPEVVSYFCGQPVDTGRKRVSSNYDVALYLGFDSEQDYLNYVRNTNHLELVAEWNDRIEKLTTYDILDEST